MVNGWYSFGSGQIKPFVGGGIGYGRITVDLVNEVNVAVDDSVDAFTWQVGAGVEYALSDSMSLIGTYRYVAAPDLELEDTDGDAFTADFSTQFASVGVLFRF